ncbi:MAG: hypothetical protein NTY22_03320, partial [Proteobacteria bacterium]|nr:hypothetical protein [Pseudomonadota bacterium]
MKKIFLVILFITFSLNIFAEDSIFDKIEKSNCLRNMISFYLDDAWDSYFKSKDFKEIRSNNCFPYVSVEWIGQEEFLKRSIYNDPDNTVLLKLNLFKFCTESIAESEWEEIQVSCRLDYLKIDGLSLNGCSSKDVYYGKFPYKHKKLELKDVSVPSNYLKEFCPEIF